MKNIFSIIVICIFPLYVFSQSDFGLRYVDALELRIINKGFSNSLTPYTRIPAYLQDSVRKDLWERSQTTTGMGVRFATNSTRIGVRYNLLTNMHMPHMADTGIKGADLYRLNDKGKWEYVNTCRPYATDSIQKKMFVENMPNEMHEYLVYLPLYDGINWFEVGVDSSAYIGQPQIDNPRQGKRIVFYGTSVMQGGCATRTGMCATNMIQRDMNIECVNIGISGEGKMDYCMARAMGSMENVAAFVIDPVPNCTKLMCDTLTYEFINIIHQMQPNTPIIMVEGFLYPYSRFDSYFAEYLPQKNQAFYSNYLKLRKNGIKNLYYVTEKGLWGNTDEGTVDGIHFTDIGFRAYADKLEKLLKKIIK